MKIMIPIRDKLIAQIPIYCKVSPLKRARANPYTKGVYQPLDNQKDLLREVKNIEEFLIEEPVFLDIIVNWEIDEKKLRKMVKTLNWVHPTNQRQGDVDNLAKAVNDALIKARVLVDDIYIVGQQITKAYGTEDVASIAIWSVKRAHGL